MSSQPAFILTPAGIATLASIGFALTSLVAAALLYWRRERAEHGARRDRELDRALSQAVLAALDEADRRPGISPLKGANPASVERVVSRFLKLLRGTDRDLLLEMADAAGIVDNAIASLANHRPARRVDAMRVLESFPVSSAIDALRRQMETDPDYAVRTEAAATLARIERLPEPQVVIDALGLATRKPNLLHAAIFRAAAAKNSREIAALAEYRSLGALRPVLAEALGWSEDYTMLPSLAKFAADPNPEMRSAALKAARRLGHPGVKDWVLALLVDGVDIVRVQAARTCGKLGFREAVPVLLKLVENPSWWVRVRAGEALAMLAPDQPLRAGVKGLR